MIAHAEAQVGRGITDSAPWNALWRDPIIWVALLVSAGTLLLYLIQPFQVDTWQKVTEHYVMLPMLMVALVALAAGIGRIEQDRERRFWRLWTVAVGFWLLIQSLYAFLPVEYWVRAFDVGIDSLYLAFYLTIILALSLNPHRTGTIPTDPVRRRFEDVAAAVVVFALMTYFVVIPAVFKPETHDTWTPSLLLYVILDVFILLRFLYMLSDCWSTRWTTLYVMLGLTATLWASTDLLEGLSYLGVAAADFDAGGALDWPWFLLLATLTVAARLKGHAFQPLGEAPAADRARERTAWSGLLVVYAVGLPLLHLAMSWSGIGGAELHSGREILVFLSALLLGGMALSYQRILERDNRRLEEERRNQDHERLVERVEEAKRQERERAESVVLQAREARQASIPARRASAGAPYLEAVVPRTAEKVDARHRQSRHRHPPVLIVDHRPTIRTMLKSALERRGFSVLMAEDGQQAVKIFGAQDVSAVLMELTVPGMADGAALREMRGANPGVPVLLMQGAGESAQEVDEDARADIIRTPFGPNGVLNRLREVLEV